MYAMTYTARHIDGAIQTPVLSGLTADAVGDTLAYFASMTGDGWVATDIAIYTMGGEPVLTMQDVYTDADGRFVFHRFNQRIGAI